MRRRSGCAWEKARPIFSSSRAMTARSHKAIAVRRKHQRNRMRAIFSHHVENELKAAFFGHSARGFFVDVGANHPQLASQTWHLEQLGWDGILIEPQPDLADEL